MQILERITVPTGDILIVEGQLGRLECLSLSDYGQANNVKANFLGLTKDIEGVEHGSMLPLSKKWVITISTQYGCSMGCSFCDVPKVGPGMNAGISDMLGQVEAAMSLHPEIQYGERLNIHFARMGEPTWNSNVYQVALRLPFTAPNFKVHPVISTMMPAGNYYLESRLEDWMYLKNVVYEGEAGLQLSINTTDPEARKSIFNNSALDLFEISYMMRRIIAKHGVKGRKIALNFAIHDKTVINAELLGELFDPTHFMCKLTPMHITTACLDNQLLTTDGYDKYYPYKYHEEALIKYGFDVLVFIPSREEDEGRITCGNAILSGTRPKI